MLDRRLIIAVPVAGVVLGALAWLAVGRGGGAFEDLQQASEILAGLRVPSPRSTRAQALAVVSGSPLFGRLPGEIEAPEATIVLQGVMRTARQQAALLAINGKAAEWMRVGETREAFTLESVDGSGATLSSSSGVRQVGFDPAQRASANASPADLPPGYRGPPEPASAPGTP